MKLLAKISSYFDVSGRCSGLTALEMLFADGAPDCTDAEGELLTGVLLVRTGTNS